MKTRTGGLTIGYRQMGSEWQQDLASVIKWNKDNGFGSIDATMNPTATVKQFADSGLRIGTIEMPGGLITADKGKRKEAVAKCAEYIKACAVIGPANHFALMLPDNPDLPRKENFGYMVESFSELEPTLKKHQARIAIEGWPGPGALCCKPEDYRAFFKECPSKVMAVNYDPSHLIRMGIDYLRFVREFGDRVCNVHAKDTELLSERLYEYGHEQPPTFAQPDGFGGMCWRYTIPGHGQARWIEIFKILQEHKYNGCVSIELEDANFNGTEDTEKLGLLQAGRFLEGC